MISLPLLTDGVVRGACPHDCPDTCAMLVHVKDGRVVRVQGDPDHPVTQGFLCTKVNRYPERTYHQDRLTRPLRRVGAKGEGRFVEATWDEALDDIARRLGDIIGRDGPEAILPYSYSGTLGLIQNSSMDRRFFHRIGASLLARTICATAGGEGWRHTYGDRMGPTPEEAENARLILLWGTNTLTSNPHLWPALRRARERNGARIVAIDPIRTRTAAQADEHLPIRPGTDAALALGMMHVILRAGIEDRAYLETHTVGWERLRGRADEWPLERAAAVTGLSAADIERLALEYATTRPTFIRLNYGLQRHAGGGMAVRAVSLLPALTGAWREIGGGATLSTSGAFPMNRQALERPDWIPAGTRTINMIRLGEALTEPDAGVGGPPVRALIVYNSNPAAVAPELGKVREGLRREDLFTVVMEHFQTDTADYADWVLPATSQVEHWDLHTSYGHLFLTLNRPAIAPLGECLPNSEIFRRLAARMGLNDPALADDDLTMIRQALEVDDPVLEGITLETLLEHGAIRLRHPEPFRPYATAGGLRTPSGKIEIHSETLARMGLDPLPTYTPPAELPDPRGGRKPRFSLMLLSPPEHQFMNSTFVNVPSLRRAAGEARVLLHPDDAGTRGIEDGDPVRVWNDRGEFRGVAAVTEDVRPGVAVSYGVRWARLSEGGRTVNDTTSQASTDLGEGAVFYDNAVEAEPVPVAGSAAAHGSAALAQTP